MGCYGHVVDVKIDSRLEEVKFRWGERKEKISPPPPRRVDSDIKTALQDTPRKVTFTRLHKSRWSRLMCPCISPNRWLSSPAEWSLSGVHHGAREMVDLDSFYLFLFICIVDDNRYAVQLSRHIRTIHCPALPAMLLWLTSWKATSTRLNMTTVTQRSSVRKAVGSTSRPFSSSRLTFRMMGISVIFTIVTVNGTNHQRNHPVTIVGHLMMTATEGIERLKFLVAIITRSFFTLFFKGGVWNFFDWIERGETRETSNDRQLIRRILLYDWLALLRVAMASKGAYYIN